MRQPNPEVERFLQQQKERVREVLAEMREEDERIHPRGKDGRFVSKKRRLRIAA